MFHPIGNSKRCRSSCTPADKHFLTCIPKTHQIFRFVPSVPVATFLNNALPPTPVNAPTVVCPIQPTGEGAQLERKHSRIHSRMHPIKPCLKIFLAIACPNLLITKLHDVMHRTTRQNREVFIPPDYLKKIYSHV